MKVIIVGATHAGTIAATEILKIHPETEVTIYERNNNFSFLSCGISLYLDGQVNRLEDMFYSSPEELRDMGAKVEDNHDVLSIDAVNHEVQVANMITGKIFKDTYDKLVMATGSTPVVPPIFGIDNAKVLLCKNYQQAQEIYQASEKYHRIAIVGAGYSGTEFAEALAKTGHEVQMFQNGDQILDNYVGKKMSDGIVDMLAQHGVQIFLNHRVTGFNGDSDGNLELETAHGNYSADAAIVTSGFVANSDLLHGQVEVEKHGSLLVNGHMQTTNPDIFAAGDCSMVRFNPTGGPAYTPLASSAVRQAVLVAHNLFHENYPYMGTQATSAIKLFGYSIATTGLTLEHALKRKINAAQVVYEGTWRPEYMPTTDALTIMMVYNRDTRRVLGAQLISKHEIAQSANAISIAIQNNNTIDDLSLVDMLFQPNFDNPFNYINIAAQLAVDQERQANNDNPRFTALGNQQGL